MKCPYCKENIKNVDVVEGKFFARSKNDTGFEHKQIKYSAAYICPNCETILQIVGDAF